MTAPPYKPPFTAPTRAEPTSFLPLRDAFGPWPIQSFALTAERPNLGHLRLSPPGPPLLPSQFNRTTTTIPSSSARSTLERSPTPSHDKPDLDPHGSLSMISRSPWYQESLPLPGKTPGSSWSMPVQLNVPPVGLPPAAPNQVTHAHYDGRRAQQNWKTLNAQAQDLAAGGVGQSFRQAIAQGSPMYHTAGSVPYNTIPGPPPRYAAYHYQSQVPTPSAAPVFVHQPLPPIARPVSRHGLPAQRLLSIQPDPRNGKPAPPPLSIASRAMTPVPDVSEQQSSRFTRSNPPPPIPDRAPRKNVRKLNPALVSTTLWEDELTIVLSIAVDGHLVARRVDNDWVNCTKLLNVVGMTRGRRDMLLKVEEERVVFRRGATNLKGVWLPFETALRLAKTYDLDEQVYPLFEPNLVDWLFIPPNRYRTEQLLAACASRTILQKGGLSQFLALRQTSNAEDQASPGTKEASESYDESMIESLAQRRNRLLEFLSRLECGLKRTLGIESHSTGPLVKKRKLSDIQEACDDEEEEEQVCSSEMQDHVKNARTIRPIPLARLITPLSKSQAKLCREPSFFNNKTPPGSPQAHESCLSRDHEADNADEEEKDDTASDTATTSSLHLSSVDTRRSSITSTRATTLESRSLSPSSPPCDGSSAEGDFVETASRPFKKLRFTSTEEVAIEKPNSKLDNRQTNMVAGKSKSKTRPPVMVKRPAFIARLDQ
ncbi:uncharacterized protein JCM15063_005380 [Sporobolomyces koalae]|uniref:uncharacterized protein n=1 Tax=Sporobolomyces koalae TaxID=500713 RepID=UPI0031717F1D